MIKCHAKPIYLLIQALAYIGPKQGCLRATIAVSKLLFGLLCEVNNLLLSSHPRQPLKAISDHWSVGKIRGVKVSNTRWHGMPPNSPWFIFIREAKLLENNVFCTVLLHCRRISNRGSSRGVLRATARRRRYFAFGLPARNAYHNLSGPAAIHVREL